MSFSPPANSAPAQRTIAVKATDAGGLSATDTATVKIVWRFTGFAGLAPSPSVNTVKAGESSSSCSAWTATRASAILAAGYPATAAHRMRHAGPDDADATFPSGKRGIGYDAKKGLYTLTWTTRQGVEGHVPHARPEARGRHVRTPPSSRSSSPLRLGRPSPRDGRPSLTRTRAAFARRPRPLSSPTGGRGACARMSRRRLSYSQPRGGRGWVASLWQSCPWSSIVPSYSPVTLT